MNLISLASLARELGVLKSKLTYYANMGILHKKAEVGKTGVYDKKETKAVLKQVDSLKKKKFTLEEIIEELKKGE